MQFTANATGVVKVCVDNRTPPVGKNPKVVALATVLPPGVDPIAKMIEVTLRRRSWLSPWRIPARPLPLGSRGGARLNPRPTKRLYLGRF